MLINKTQCVWIWFVKHTDRDLWFVVLGIVHGITQAKDVDKDNYNYKEAELQKKKARVYT